MLSPSNENCIFWKFLWREWGMAKQKKFCEILLPVKLSTLHMCGASTKIVIFLSEIPGCLLKSLACFAPKAPSCIEYAVWL